MSLVLSLCRARSSLFPLLRLSSPFPCLLSCWIHPSVRWIPSELNASDAESRQQALSDEHSALALLATCSLKPPVCLSKERTVAPKRCVCRQELTGSTQRSNPLSGRGMLLQPESPVTHKHRLPTSERDLEVPARSNADAASRQR